MKLGSSSSSGPRASRSLMRMSERDARGPEDHEHLRGVHDLAGELPLDLAGQRRLLDRVEVELEADDGGRGVSVHRQGILLHREQREDVAVRAMALGRAGAAIA